MTNTRTSCLLAALASVRTPPTVLAWTLPSPQPTPLPWHARTAVPRSAASARLDALVLSSSSSNNVVLSPSRDEPAAFDSFAIGSPRVHRYTREGSDDDAEYVMWYEGRSVDMANDEAASVPPHLTTGRVGRATSRNGLSWKKDRTGSESEDMKGVSLGLNKDSWWGFDTAHVGLGNVLLPMSTPAVLSDAGVFLMYYHGGSDETTPATDYGIPQESSGKDVKGMKMRIGVALSQDGISFGRVEGDDPTGACIVPFDKADPNQKADQTNVKIQEEMYCAWPEVVLNQPISGGDANFLMYYSTMTKADKVRCIAQAVSPDGFRWTKTGVCLSPGPEGSYDAGGCERCCVLRDAEYDPATGSWTELASWIMYYEGISAVDGKHRIMEARSKDGSTWTKSGLALAPREEADAWDCAGVRSPHVLR